LPAICCRSGAPHDAPLSGRFSGGSVQVRFTAALVEMRGRINHRGGATMEYQPSFWIGLLCFVLFLGGIAARLANQWRNPGSRFRLGGKWTPLDALCPIGFVLMDIWLYQNGEPPSFSWIMMVFVAYMYWKRIRERKRQDSAITSNA
jgi:hypothetical protein